MSEHAEGRDEAAAEIAAMGLEILAGLTAMILSRPSQAIKAIERLRREAAQALLYQAVENLAMMTEEFGPDRLCPKCPRCGAMSETSMPSAKQLFCPAKACDVLTWDPTVPAAVQLADPSFVSMEPS